MTSCPSCGYDGPSGFDHNHFYVFTCYDCGREYCFKCDGSDRGAKCPRCGCKDQRSKEKVYER